MKAYGLAFLTSFYDYLYHAFKSLIYFVDFVVKYMPHALDVLFVLVDTSEIFVLMLLTIILIVVDFLLITFIFNLQPSSSATKSEVTKNDDNYYNFFKYFFKKF